MSVNNIFFDFDKSTLRPESTSELERLIKLMKDIPTLVIEISGHTDNKGSAEYNKKLSESRAISVVNYLVSKGVANNRLKYMGYGFEQPIATNDTDEGRQLNRRTEFKIIQR
jgi:outer membrane protein OmpA-like peptidoglycan-associated protein